MSRLSAFALLIVLVWVRPVRTQTILSVLVATENLSTLASILLLPGYESMVASLERAGNLTFFAPTNDAFSTSPVDASDTELTLAQLRYHLRGSPTEFSVPLQFVHTSLNSPAYVELGSGVSQVVGISTNFSTTPATTVSVNFGSPVDVANVVTANIACSNGVINVVDRVFQIPGSAAAAAQSMGATDFVDAVNATGLLDTLNTTPHLTVFVPTNAAFAASVPAWRDMPVADLALILQNHIVPTVYYSTELAAGATVTSLAGRALPITTTTDGSIVINGTSLVIVPNVLVSNGVLHMIDTVLLPWFVTAYTSQFMLIGTPGGNALDPGVAVSAAKDCLAAVGGATLLGGWAVQYLGESLCCTKRGAWTGSSLLTGCNGATVALLDFFHASDASMVGYDSCYSAPAPAALPMPVATGAAVEEGALDAPPSLNPGPIGRYGAVDLADGLQDGAYILTVGSAPNTTTIYCTGMGSITSTVGFPTIACQLYKQCGPHTDDYVVVGVASASDTSTPCYHTCYFQS